MVRRFAPALLALALVAGCAGPAKLAQKSGHKLAEGDHWQAWALATRALDKAPANPEARAAASAAAASIASDWQRRIHAIAEADTLAAAQQVLEFAAFRTRAARYTTISTGTEWLEAEQALRHSAARTHFQRGVSATAARRPKQAWLHFHDAEHFVSGYRDAVARADKARDAALTRVAFVPFATVHGDATFGRGIAAAWRDEIAQRMVAPGVQFTRVLGSETVESAMPASRLGRVTREQAVRLGRDSGAERVVWGTIGPVRSDTRLHLFRETIARRVVEKTPDGREVTRWIEVPIEVVARERIATVDVTWELIATRGGAAVARQREERSTGARVVWTSYAPEGDLGAYALVSETARAADPERCRQIESRWATVCGAQTTLRQVLEARRSTRGGARYDRNVLPRFAAGAAFVFLEDLPPGEDLAFAALSNGWQALRDDLVRLDAVDEVDLGVALAGDKINR
jgi:hypothetical protein